MEAEKRTSLNDKQERFCYEYCVDFNATQAAIRAGYSEKTARQIGSRLLTNVDIKTRISEMQKNLAETAGISALRIVKEHEKIAFFNSGRLRNGWITLKDFESLSEKEQSCIQEVSTKTIKRVLKKFEDGEFVDDPIEEEWIKIKVYDKQKSLDSLASILGVNGAQKVDMSVEGTQTIVLTKTYEADSKTD